MPEWKRIMQALPRMRNLKRLFDSRFYLEKYPDVAAARVNPFRHYIEYGAFEGRKPHPLFDPGYYFLRCPAARDSSEPAVMHFLGQTGEICPNPHPLFDCASYLRARPNALAPAVNPLLHYVMAGRPLVPAAVGSLRSDLAIARLTFMDVPLAIAFAREEREARPNLVEGLVLVWEDSDGRMQFIAPPEQRPFFETMKYDQLRAQLKSSS